ncbi:SEA (Seh1-associated) complex subunit, partial [Oleoguttula sp. CCFEE 5521]
MSVDAAIPRAPPLPALKTFQRARDAANRIFGYASRPPSPQNERPAQPSLEGRRGSGRLASLGASQNATASHKTGLEIKTLSINESGTHALLGGKDIFKTIRVEDGVCVEEINLRAAIRSNPTQASGKPRQIYNIDIADVAWAKGDTGEFVAAATESGKIIIYDLGHAGLPAAQLHEHYRQVHRITCNPHKGSLLLSGSQDGTVRLWDVRDAKQPVGATRPRSNVQSKSKFAGTTDGVRDVKWSPTDAMDFAFATDGGSVQVWDMRYFNRPKVKIIAHNSTCMSVDWHPDGKHLASAGLDHMIKVWDTSIKSGRKGNWEVKTPYPLSNARWRPACEVGWSDDDDDNTMRQCTQLLAAYDRSHPELHIWDVRRPALPFRELVPYTESPTDLLWHSQDLLWTVGRDGTFLQNDIQHSSLKVMDRYPVNATAISPTGEIASFNMRRNARPINRQYRASSGHAPDSALLSRSWADDSLDDSFLRAHPEVMKQKQRRQHSRQSSDVGIPIHPTRTNVISLDQVFGQRRAVRPTQTAWRGQLPAAYCTDPLVF